MDGGMSHPAILSLSSIPPRFSALRPVLEALVAQDLPAAEIRLHIPRRYRRFPDWDGHLPDIPRGVRLVRCETDFGPATKLLPALTDLAGQDVDILYCDDDWICPPGWHRRFVVERARRPGVALGSAGYLFAPLIAPPPAPRARPVTRLEMALRHRLTDGQIWGPQYRRAGRVRILGGWGGVMVRPDFFDAAVFDLPPVLWAVDDVWLSGHLERRGVELWTGPGLAQPAPHDPARHRAPLLEAELDGLGRAAADHACVRHFRDLHGIWPEPPPDRARRLARRLLPAGLRRALWWLRPPE
jgi:hypothetical protein